MEVIVALGRETLAEVDQRTVTSLPSDITVQKMVTSSWENALTSSDASVTVVSKTEAKTKSD